MRILFGVLASLVSLGLVSAQAQQYPSRPVHIIVGFAAGSGPDVEARAVAQQLGADLGQNFIVENRPGADATIASEVLVQSPPDGYTLLFTSDSIAPTPFIYKHLSYDVLKDLAPVATVGVLDGLLMLVNQSSPAHNVGEFIAYAKTHRVLYGSPGVGNGLHLAGALFNKATVSRWSMSLTKARPKSPPRCSPAISTSCS
jgi:tripartite-type tricarboxylate transporter receptor subunit TctC